MRIARRTVLMGAVAFTLTLSNTPLADTTSSIFSFVPRYGIDSELSVNVLTLQEHTYS